MTRCHRCQDLSGELGRLAGQLENTQATVATLQAAVDAASEAVLDTATGAATDREALLRIEAAVAPVATSVEDYRHGRPLP